MPLTSTVDGAFRVEVYCETLEHFAIKAIEAKDLVASTVKDATNSVVASKQTKI